MDVKAPYVARRCQPGQFLIVRYGELGERVPLTICDYDREAGTITIVFQIVGASTEKFNKFATVIFFAINGNFYRIHGIHRPRY